MTHGIAMGNVLSLRHSLSDQQKKMTGMSPSFSSDVIYSGLVPAFGKSWWDHETVHVTMVFAGIGSLLLVNGHARARVPEALDEV